MTYYNDGMKKRYRNRLYNILALLILAGCLIYGVFYFQSDTEPYSSEAVVIKEEELPEYAGDPSVEFHENIPFFSKDELFREPFEEYGERDGLGRCTYAYALIDADMMPDDERESLLDIYPTGFQNREYPDLIEDGFLYNRCHLIAFELTGENVNMNNLVTGTRYMNIEGMLPYENKCASYIRRTGNHVLYRVTPVFIRSELVCRGVLIEAESVEDGEIRFCVFCFNVQPGIKIDYQTGQNKRD